MIDEMAADRTFGQIAIAFRYGHPDYIRKETTEKIGAQGNTRQNVLPLKVFPAIPKTATSAAILKVQTTRFTI